MAPDRTILHLVEKKIPDPLSMLLACTLLSLSYAPVNNSCRHGYFYSHICNNNWVLEEEEEGSDI